MDEHGHEEALKMKKQWICGWIALALMICSAGCAVAEERHCVIAPLQSIEARVKLRKHPDTGAEILGQYFAGVEVTVYESNAKGWAKVEIGGRQGFMMEKFLAPAGSDSALYSGQPGCVRYEETAGQGVPLRTQTGGRGELMAWLKQGDRVRVLGTVSADWLHVCLEADGQRLYGYVSSAVIAQADNFAHARVNTGKADETVNIRKEPDRKSTVLGRLFCGVQVDRLFDDHVADDGWDRVRIGPVIGYIQKDFLDYSTAGCPAFQPPVAELRETDGDLYADAARKQKTGVLVRYDPVWALGVFGDSYLVRVETWISTDTRGDEYAFLAMGDVKARIIASASTAGILRQDTPFFQRETAAGPIRQAGLLEKGRRVLIVGTADENGNFVSEYMLPDAEYLLVETETPDGGVIDVYVPAGAVEHDPGLDMPEDMTLG